MKEAKVKNHKAPSEERTISAVLDDPGMKEEIIVEGFRRGFDTQSKAAAKCLELGLIELKKLPVLETRASV